MNDLAIFDVDGTLVRPPSLESRFLRFLWQYGELSTRELAWHFAAAGLSCFSGKAPQAAPRFYLSGMKIEKVNRLAEDFIEQEIIPSIYREALERINDHRKNSVGIWLLSGAPAFLLRPLAVRVKADFVIGLEVESRDGVFREGIHGIHPRGKGKLMLIQKAISENGCGLANSFAYGDSIQDRYILEAAKHATAVNPDRKLRYLALKRGWEIRDFREEGGYRRND